MPGLVSQYVLNQVKNALQARSVVVWFDEENAYPALLPALDLPNCTVIPWNGSYYEMAYLAHKPFAKLSKANRAKGHTQLLYVPRKEAEATPLLEFSMAGEAFSLPLRVAAQRALHHKVPQSALEELLAKQRPTLADLDQMGEAGGQPSLLQALFPGDNDTDIIFKYLTAEGVEQKIDDRGALPDLVTLSRSAYGIPDAAAMSSHVDLKATLWRHLLLTALREGLTPQPGALVNTPQPTADQYRRVADTLTMLRRDEPDTYAAMAGQVAAETGVAGWGLVAAAVPNHETFAFLEEAALPAVQRLVTEAQDVAGAARLVERYRTSFWVKRQERRILQWRAADLAVGLCQSAATVAEHLKETAALTPAEAVERYAAPGTGWWLLDTAQRRLEAHVAHMEEEFLLDRLLHHARYRYERTLDELAGRFSDALSRHGFQFDHTPHQADVFSTFVEPLLSKQERVAFILVDALRFEMGRELHDTLTGTAEKAITAAVGTPPTITQVGMAALMPGAEKGVSLAVDGKVGLAIGETAVIGSAARRDWVKARTGGGWAEDITLDELVSDTEKKVKGRLDKKTLVVVRSQEIDDHGEDDYRHAARQTMTMVLGALRKAIARLAKLGFTQVVIAADHGHLFGEEYGDDRKIDPPTGELVELHRRCWIGRHPSAPAHTMHFRASDLGLGGDLELVVPRGLAIFKAKGGAQSYFHGGLSLQELVIPVITAELTAPGKGKAGKANDLILKPTKDRVVNRLFPVDVTFASAVEPTRVVQISAIADDGQEVGRAMGAGYGFNDQTQEITLQTQNPNQVFVQLSMDLEGAGSLTVQAQDPRTGLVLAQVTLPYELA